MEELTAAFFKAVRTMLTIAVEGFLLQSHVEPTHFIALQNGAATEQEHMIA